ncbi:NAD(P)H-hydrate dehydratase [Rubrivivax gelatinosus]|uniref:Bifunctional NAD(P)H-hydrate repair enzyme n=1 Tax=Rubrivivax gelatinosus TaxID=28068 RepID=A0ABS1DRC4_RUBGE|nr:NAD(P)H-hydrate dehydratase [Rubrivivax gelatinosus]MBK1712554.1 bifunctional ADP-dependent NAD(P)H-hydrate dehydratase/NAD(P)H-hydrate epimerase [Rubrivivax gelatinosus]
MSPVPVTPERGWPLHTSAASRAAEAAALAVTPPHALMQRAGLGVARLALALAPHARTIAVLAGPGNNGGDGLVAARHLHAAGKALRVVLLGDEQRLPADAADALQAARAAGVPITDRLDEAPADLVVDALLGLGTTRAPEGRIAEAIAWAAARGGPVLAVDLPTGLHPDTGQPLGAACVRATATLSLLTLKPGLFTGAGRDLAGSVWLDTLGVEAGAESARLAPAPEPRPRAHVQHKGSFGDVVVVGGAPGMGGAAWLAARAALAAGAGRVYCSPLDPAAALLDPAHPELMGRGTWWRSPPAELAAATVVCGCGGGGAVRAALPPLLAHAVRLLLDADALNAVASDPSLQRLLAGRAGRGQQTILTPHPLEAARLLGTGAAEVQSDRIAAAERLAARFAAVVVLKGSGSIVAAPGAKPSLNPTGNALLASAGTGDVLAGWMAGGWMPGREAHPVAVDAVWQHGRAADLALACGATHPLLASALIDALHAAA